MENSISTADLIARRLDSKAIVLRELHVTILNDLYGLRGTDGSQSYLHRRRDDS